MVADTKLSTVTSVLNNDLGAIVVSVILGLGLAVILRATCRGESCVVIQSPPLEQIHKHIYKIDDQCYKYTSYAVGCPGADDSNLLLTDQ